VQDSQTEEYAAQHPAAAQACRMKKIHCVWISSKGVRLAGYGVAQTRREIVRDTSERPPVKRTKRSKQTAAPISYVPPKILEEFDFTQFQFTQDVEMKGSIQLFGSWRPFRYPNIPMLLFC
jgi:hypothetical protein